MRVALVDQKDPRDLVVDKTIAGGMGTATRYGGTLLTRALTAVKSRAIRIAPYNVAYVAAILRRAGHDVHLSAGGEGDADVAVVFTAIPSHTVDVALVASLADRGTPCFVVGTLAGVASERYAGASAVVSGEPEAFFLRPDWHEARGLVRAGQVSDLDALPFPDWGVFPRLDSHYAIVALGRTVLPVVTSRGCPFPCGYYCPYPLGEGTTMRFREPGGVVEELRWLGSEHGVSAVKFRDPIFTVNRKRTVALLDALARSGVGVAWGCETHLARLDEDLLRAMADAGCTLIQAGIESTNPDAIAASRRRSTEQAHQERMLELAGKLGIKTAIYFILGLPDDTVPGMAASLAYAATLPATFLQITLCTPYPGTRFFADVEDRLLTRDWRSLDQYTHVLGSDHFTATDLERLMSRGYRDFYLRPGWVRGVVQVARA